jgi:alkanesulfonate monooxygenase SsuD/methylene tetrahydromethanopterin reductase-like flavin-dependent oxidoreductase (luciferase family)
MTAVIVLALEVGAGDGALSLPEAVEALGLAEAAGVPVVRIRDGDDATLDPSIVASYLAGRFAWASFVIEAATTYNAPYNLARRVLSLDRATAGRAGVALKPGGGDEVSAATAPIRTAADAAGRWSEYAGILVRLWESFPADALLGDQDAGIFADDERIVAVGHEGRFYRVAGPLDGPSSPQSRPVIVADADQVDWETLAPTADAVVVTAARSTGADPALRQALERVGRRRDEVALLGRAVVSADEDALPLREWAERDSLDGFELVPDGGLPGWSAVVSRLVPQLEPAPSGPWPTLRSGLRLPDLAEVRR